MKKLLLLVLLLPSLLFGQYCEDATIQINLDQYPSETSWEITDTSGNVLFYHGSYAGAPFYQPQVYTLCLPVGPLEFTIFDLYGDGLAGSLWGGQDGSYYVVQCGDTLVDGSFANFGYDSTHAFVSAICPPPPIVLGCTDSLYFEYMPNANLDDGSCSTLVVTGCLDTLALNYDSLANTMELVDSCSFDLYLHDLIGNGWVGSRLEVYQGQDTSIFVMTPGGTSQFYNINLQSPELVTAKFFINQQAFGTLNECGFSLINPFGDTVMSVVPPFILPFVTYQGMTYCGDICIDRIFGCQDPLAFNYVDSANTAQSCYYYPGCISPAYLEYHIDTTNNYYTDINVQDSCINTAMFGCTDLTAFNYDASANVDNGGCLPVVLGCMQPLAFNYNPIANTPDSCIAIVYGCMTSGTLNYNPLANVDDGSCIAIILGCTDPNAFNYQPQANVNDGSCIAKIYGCTDATMFNYDQLANVDNGSCIPFIYGCTDSTAFNYNPIANADNNSCTPFIYGCTDPSALNYSPSANTEDFSCIAYVYGCMDSLALNYDSLANTDNGSCITIIMGCMDQAAYNYDGNANVNDSISCNYNAGCITGPGNPYWLNDPCYAWVIDVDNYCCENEWDEVCQSMYNYCDNTWTGPILTREESLVIYPNPTSSIININKSVNAVIYNNLGDVIISANNTNVLDVSKISPGSYILRIEYKEKIIYKKIIKK